MRRPLSRTLALQGLQGAPGALARRARAMPSLDLRFAETKSLTDWISGQNLITFTRASSGTVVNAAGALETVASNLPRLTHNPLTGESLGLLLEEQRTNLLLRSEEFGTTWTTSNASISTDSTLSPDGQVSADSLIENTANAQHNMSQTVITLSDSTVITVSVYAKSFGRNWMRLSVIAKDGSLPGAYFDLSTGSTGAVVSSPITTSITSVGNGWYRCSVTASTSSGATLPGLRMWTSSANGTINYTGDGTSGIHLWGAQLEAGAFLTGYIPTAGATATRSADLADLISAAIANNIRAIYVEFRSPASGIRGVLSLNDNTANERSAILTSGTDSALLVHDNGIEQANIIGGSIAANARVRVACRINQDSFAISVNGGIARTDNTGAVPTVDRLMIGRTQAGDYLNASIARIVGWVEPLPDATLQAITR